MGQPQLSTFIIWQFSLPRCIQSVFKVNIFHIPCLYFIFMVTSLAQAAIVSNLEPYGCIFLVLHISFIFWNKAKLIISKLNMICSPNPIPIWNSSVFPIDPRIRKTEIPHGTNWSNAWPSEAAFYLFFVSPLEPCHTSSPKIPPTLVLSYNRNLTCSSLCLHTLPLFVIE